MHLLIGLALAGDRADSDDTPVDQPDAVRTPVAGRMEFSFGSSLLIREQALLGQEVTRIVPVGSVLMLAEYLVRPRFSTVGFVNVPTGAARELQDDGSVVEHHAAAAVAAGVAWAPVILPISEQAWFKPQLGAFGGTTIRSTRERAVPLFPLAAIKLNVTTNDGFTMYVGASYAFSENTFAVLYGAGHRF